MQNPVVDRLVKLQIGHLKTNAAYTLTNTNGRLVKKGIINPNDTSINLSSLPAGLYFLQIEGIKETTKLVLQWETWSVNRQSWMLPELSSRPSDLFGPWSLIRDPPVADTLQFKKFRNEWPERNDASFLLLLVEKSMLGAPTSGGSRIIIQCWKKIAGRDDRFKEGVVIHDWRLTIHV